MDILTGSNGLSGGLDVVTTPSGGTEVVFLNSTVLEPSTLALLGLGFAAVGFTRRRHG
jgi:PEP-CTERM motif